MQGREEREIPEKTRRLAASSGTIPTCDNPGVTPIHHRDSSLENSTLESASSRALSGNGALDACGGVALIALALALLGVKRSRCTHQVMKLDAGEQQFPSGDDVFDGVVHRACWCRVLVEVGRGGKIFETQLANSSPANAGLMSNLLRPYALWDVVSVPAAHSLTPPSAGVAWEVMLLATGSATTQECSGETGRRHGPPQRIRELGKILGDGLKHYIYCRSPSGRQSLMEAMAASEVFLV
ncbi:hypothetical protein PR048_022047 [Dryococelus australis]|uniref:Uncharacterized protein n=1 Tax=Dryococelus australis TaxID=614101 RepID=A0ABQ9GZX4_9NEOP|nr:hypothetical protein PR048_022047 [Dryococelus australis]